MNGHLSNHWTYAVAFLEFVRGDAALATGSGFYWLHEGRTYLVTNWHNLSGRNPLTGKPMSPTGATPEYVRIMAYAQVSPEDANGFFQLTYVPVTVRLLSPDDHPRWREHPRYGRRVDIAVLDVTEAISDYRVCHVNVIESDAVLDPVASQEVFVVGFPFGLIAGAPAPLWKRGSIALDPTYDPEGLPKLLVDTATREGMSGSVVLEIKPAGCVTF